MIPRSIYPNSGVKGLDIVMANLQKALEEIEGKSIEGLIRAGVEIRRSTEKTIPLTPIDLGNLRASWFLVSIKGSEPDPEGFAGNFRNRPFKKMQNPASKLKSEHSEVIKAAQSKVNSIKDPVVITGYSANYAMWVHEMQRTYPDVHWSREGSGGKWFQAAIANNKGEIVKIVARYAKIP